MRSRFTVDTADKKYRLLEFSRYLAAGTVSFLSDFCVLYLLTALAGINYLISNIFGYLVGFVVAYLLSIRWVFRYRRYSSITPELAIFVLVGLLGIALNEWIMYLAVAKFAQNYLFAKILATGIAFLVNFALRKSLLFCSPRRQHGKTA